MWNTDVKTQIDSSSGLNDGYIKLEIKMSSHMS